jgi:uncharacterized membrane protein
MEGPELVQVMAAALVGLATAFVVCVRALVRVLAVSNVRGGQAAILGVLAGILIQLVGAWIVFQLLLDTAHSEVHLIVGALLLLFGLRWLREAMLRAIKNSPPRDFAEDYAKELAKSHYLKRAFGRLDTPAFIKVAGIVTFDLIEVTFVAVALSAGGVTLLAAATSGALLATFLLVPLALVFGRAMIKHIVRSLTVLVGVVMSAFGTIWAGDGIGAVWPRLDVTLVSLTIGYLVVALGYVHLARRGAPASRNLRE